MGDIFCEKIMYDFSLGFSGIYQKSMVGDFFCPAYHVEQLAAFEFQIISGVVAEIGPERDAVGFH